MTIIDTAPDYRQDHEQRQFSAFLRPLLSPVPLFLVQPALAKIVRHISQDKPELFNRVGPHKNKLFLIDPTNLPFIFVLKPHPDHPSFKAYRRRKQPKVDAKISGTFLTLLAMVDGQLDGDSLFFSRELCIEGDTEAVVCLRNALDDMDGSVAEEAANLFGPIGRRTLKALKKVRHHGSP